MCFADTSDIKLTETDFESGQDSAILVRERTRGSKLEGAYKKKKGTLLEETEHTVTFLSAGKGKATIMSKRDIMLGTMIGHDQFEPCCSKDADRWLQKERESLNDTAIMSETHSSGEQQTNSEAQNESNDSIQEIASFPPEQSTSAMTEQPIRSEKQTKTKRPAIEKLKKAIRQQRRQRQNKKKKQQTVNSPNLKTINALESDEEEMMAKEKDEEQQQKKTRIRGRNKANNATRERTARTTRAERAKRVATKATNSPRGKREQKRRAPKIQNKLLRPKRHGHTD